VRERDIAQTLSITLAPAVGYNLNTGICL